MSLSSHLAQLAEVCSLDDLQQTELRGHFVELQEYPTMKKVIIPKGDVEFYIGWYKEKIEQETVKRKEKIHHWNKLGQLQFPHLKHYYIFTQGDKEFLVTPDELELMKTIRSARTVHSLESSAFVG